MKASDLFVKALEHEGVEYLFAVPGEENLDVLESIRTSSIRLVLNRHEQGAAFMAAAYGRMTGKPGVCMSTLGPGATNLVTGAAYAQLGAMPMILITGQKPIKKSKQGQFQIVDVVEMMKPITKHAVQIVNGSRISSVVREAFRYAEEERPGAVHLELPEDIAREEVEDVHFFEISHTRRPAAEQKAISRAKAMIEAAKSPLILVGAGANRKRSSNHLRNFIEKTGIPFFTTQMGKGVVDERHDLSLGTAALSDKDYLHWAIDHADLIINVGHDVIEKPPFFMEHGGKKVIHINFFTAQVDEVYFPQLEVIGDIANSLWQLSEAIEKQNNWDCEYYVKAKKEIEARIEVDANSDAFPLIPQRVVTDVRRIMPESGILSLDNGIYKVWFARNYQAYQPNTILLDNALATMGAGLPVAMGVKLVHPDRKVVAVCGDGGFMMNSQELETAVRLKLDIVCIILNDSAYGMIKWKQAGMGFPDWGLDYKNPDFVKYAEAYGAHGHRVTAVDEFATILEKCLSSDGVHLIDCPIDYSENKKVLIDELKARSERFT